MSARIWKRRRTKDRIRASINAACASPDPVGALFAGGVIRASSNGKGTMRIALAVSLDDIRAALDTLRAA